MKRINVLSIRNIVAFGGPDTTLLGWYAHIDRDRFNVSFASFDGVGGADQPMVEALAELGVQTYPIRYGSGKNVFAAIRSIVRLVRELDIDIIHTHDHRSDAIGYFAARLAGVPVMTTVYIWFKDLSVRKMYYLERLQRFFLHHFDGVTAISEATRQETIGFGFAPEDVSTVLSGCDLGRFDIEVDKDAVRASLGVTADDFILPYVARLYPEKAHSNFMQAMEEVVAKEPRAKAVFIGVGILADALAQEARERGLESNVILTGLRHDVPEILRTSTFMVHPSLAEGIPLAVYEGMGAGLAVVGTDVDGTPEVVRHEETGLLVPTMDPAALSAAILRLIEDEPLRNRLAKAARALMEEDYSVQRATAQLEDYYTALAERCPSRKQRKG